MNIINKLSCTTLVCVIISEAAHGMDFNWASAYSTGSPRIELRTLTEKNSPADQQRAAGLAASLGALHASEGVEHLFTDIRVGPLLRYDDNINNGVHQDSFTFNGLKFLVDEESRAVAGPLLGANATMYSKFSYATGSTISLFMSGSYEKALNYDLSVRSGSASLCANQYLTGWTWGGLCHTASFEDRALSSSNADITSLSVDTVFRALPGVQEFVGEVGSIRDENSRRGFSSLKLRHATNHNAAFSLGLYGEENRSNTTFVESRIDVGFSRLIGERILSASIYRTIEGVGYVFGTERKDEVYGVKLSKEINQSIGANIYFKKRKSNVSLFDSKSFGISFDFQDFSLLR